MVCKTAMRPGNFVPYARFTRRLTIRLITTGAPKMDVTVPTDSSVGENAVLAIRSQNRQNAAPLRNAVGMMIMGLAVFINIFAT